MTEPTETLRRVLHALVEVATEANPDDPTSAGILDEIVAQRLGMPIEEVQRHVQTLADFGFLRMEETP